MDIMPADARRRVAFAEGRVAAAQRMLEEAMRIMTDDQLAAFRKRALDLDAGDLEQSADDRGDGSPHSDGTSISVHAG
jgi:hypothetical protein